MSKTVVCYIIKQTETSHQTQHGILTWNRWNMGFETKEHCHKNYIDKWNQFWTLFNEKIVLGTKNKTLKGIQLNEATKN